MTIGVVAGMIALAPLVRGGTAVSEEAEVSRQKIAALVRSTESSQALFGEKAAAITNLREMASECAQEDWDGQGSLGMSPAAVAQAIDFVRAFPDGLPLPEFAPEPDGSVSLEWLVSRHRRFMVSAGERERLAFAWVDGTDRGHGVARFDGCSIPERILKGLESILPHERTSVRTA
jgi:hypothetical protein